MFMDCFLIIGFSCREVQHRNVVRFIGACTKSPHLCIVTGMASEGKLYSLLCPYAVALVAYLYSFMQDYVFVPKLLPFSNPC